MDLLRQFVALLVLLAALLGTALLDTAQPPARNATETNATGTNVMNASGTEINGTRAMAKILAVQENALLFNPWLDTFLGLSIGLRNDFRALAEEHVRENIGEPAVANLSRSLAAVQTTMMGRFADKMRGQGSAPYRYRQIDKLTSAMEAKLLQAPSGREATMYLKDTQGMAKEVGDIYAALADFADGWPEMLAAFPTMVRRIDDVVADFAARSLGGMDAAQREELVRDIRERWLRSFRAAGSERWGLFSGNGSDAGARGAEEMMQDVEGALDAILGLLVKAVDFSADYLGVINEFYDYAQDCAVRHFDDAANSTKNGIVDMMLRYEIVARRTQMPEGEEYVNSTLPLLERLANEKGVSFNVMDLLASDEDRAGDGPARIRALYGDAGAFFKWCSDSGAIFYDLVNLVDSIGLDFLESPFADGEVAAREEAVKNRERFLAALRRMRPARRRSHGETLEGLLSEPDFRDMHDFVTDAQLGMMLGFMGTLALVGIGVHCGYALARRAREYRYDRVSQA